VPNERHGQHLSAPGGVYQLRRFIRPYPFPRYFPPEYGGAITSNAPKSCEPYCLLTGITSAKEKQQLPHKTRNDIYFFQPTWVLEARMVGL